MQFRKVTTEILTKDEIIEKFRSYSFDDWNMYRADEILEDLTDNYKDIKRVSEIPHIEAVHEISSIRWDNYFNVKVDINIDRQKVLEGVLYELFDGKVPTRLKSRLYINDCDNWYSDYEMYYELPNNEYDLEICLRDKDLSAFWRNIAEAYEIAVSELKDDIQHAFSRLIHDEWDWVNSDEYIWESLEANEFYGYEVIEGDEPEVMAA